MQILTKSINAYTDDAENQTLNQQNSTLGLARYAFRRFSGTLDRRTFFSFWFLCTFVFCGYQLRVLHGTSRRISEMFGTTNEKMA